MFTKNIEIQILSFLFVFSVFAEEAPYAPQTATQDWKNYEIEGEVIYNKKYLHKKSHELTALGGLYFRNDLNSTFGLGGNYTYHFTEDHSWEIINAVYLSNRETLLRKEIKEKTGLVPEAEDNDLFVTTAYVLHPVYGKISLFGKRIIHFDLFFLLGAGARKQVGGYAFGLAGVAGGGFRFYLSNTYALKLEARDLLFSETHMDGNTFIQAFVPSIGISFRL